jgi:hypothetical protein
MMHQRQSHVIWTTDDPTCLEIIPGLDEPIFVPVVVQQKVLPVLPK